MRLTGIFALLVCCLAGLACVTYVPQPVYTQPPVNAAAPEPAPAPVAEDTSSGAEDQPFYDDLAPYGRWVYVSGPGWVWSPYNTPAGWQPYQMGHWVYTDYGWTWASDESFGWAVYHYGRWNYDPSYGWVWAPGTEWGPAWVAWHEGGGYVGWAPLPYQATWQVGVGLNWGGVNMNVALGPSSWHFVQTQYMVDPGMRYRVAPPSRNVTLIHVTQNVTNYVTINNHVVDHGVVVEHVGRAVGHPIPHYRVHDGDSADNDHGGKVRGEDFVVYRPNPGRGWRTHGRDVPPGHEGSGQRGQGSSNDSRGNNEDHGRNDPGQGHQEHGDQSQDSSDHPKHQYPWQRPGFMHGNSGQGSQQGNSPSDADVQNPAGGKRDNPNNPPSATGNDNSGGQSQQHPGNPGSSAPSQGQGSANGQQHQPNQGNGSIAHPASDKGHQGKPANAKTPPGKAKGKKPGKPQNDKSDSKDSDGKPKDGSGSDSGK